MRCGVILVELHLVEREENNEREASNVRVRTTRFSTGSTASLWQQRAMRLGEKKDSIPRYVDKMYVENKYILFLLCVGIRNMERGWRTGKGWCMITCHCPALPIGPVSRIFRLHPPGPYPCKSRASSHENRTISPDRD